MFVGYKARRESAHITRADIRRAKALMPLRYLDYLLLFESTLPRVTSKSRNTFPFWMYLASEVTSGELIMTSEEAPVRVPISAT